MSLKNSGISLGIAFLLPIFVYCAVNVSNLCPINPYDTPPSYLTDPEALKDPNIGEKIKDFENKYQKYEKANLNSKSRLFYIAILIGILATIAGAFFAPQAIGQGLILGGILTFLEGYWLGYSYEVSGNLKFIFVLLMFCFLVLWDIGKLNFTELLQRNKKDQP